MFRSKRDEVTEGWTDLQNEELRDLYSLPSIIRIMKLVRMRWAGHVVYTLLVGKPERKKPLGTPRLRWVVNTKLHLIGMKWGGVDWIGLAQDGDK
jgi:hypothetical protein